MAYRLRFRKRSYGAGRSCAPSCARWLCERRRTPWKTAFPARAVEIELGHPRSFGPTPFVFPLLFFTSCRHSHSCLSAAPARPLPTVQQPPASARPCVTLSQNVITAKILRRCQKLRRSVCELRSRRNLVEVLNLFGPQYNSVVSE